MEPRFTVLLPTHNRAEVVGHAIRSVLAQTRPDFELLVVGDGCTDDTARVVHSFGDERVRWFDLPKAPNFGYANRNVALREARGALVAFMAHDDLILADHLELMDGLFADDEVDWAYSRPLWVSDDGRIVPFAVDLRRPPQREVFLTHHNSIPASCIVYRRECHERFGYWPEATPAAGDWEIWRRMVAAGDGSNIRYLPAPTTLHFRADWRESSGWGPPPLGPWLELASTDEWPRGLRFAVPDGATPQAAFVNQVVDLAWVESMRADVEAAIELLAWTMSVEPERVAGPVVSRHLAHIAELEQKAGRLEATLRQSRAERSAAQSEARALSDGLSSVEELLAARERDLDETGNQLAEARSDVELARSQLGQARTELDQARGQLAEANERLRSRRLPTLARRAFRRVVLAARGNPLFDRRWYRRTYADVGSADPYRHWRDRGAAERRDPSPYFSTAAYLDAHPDVRSSGMNPLDHYYLFGSLEGRQVASAPAENRLTSLT